MNFYRTFTVLLCFCVINCFTDETTDSSQDSMESDPEVDPSDDDYSGFSTTTLSYFSDMPENVQVVYIEAETLIKFDNKGEKMMGVSDEKCDNGRVC